MKLTKIYEELLDEDLEYAKTDTEGEEDDEFTIGCDTSVVPFNTDLPELKEGAGNKIVAYHGRQSKYNNVGELFDRINDDGTEQEGPGVYFTTKLEEAKNYVPPNGYIYVVELYPNNLLSVEPKGDFEYLIPSVTKLIKSAPNWKGIAMGYDDGIDEMVYQFIGMGQSEKEVFVNLYHEVFKGNAKLFVNGMDKLGYDALYLPSRDEGGHVVVYNPNIIKVLSIKQV